MASVSIPTIMAYVAVGSAIAGAGVSYDASVRSANTAAAHNRLNAEAQLRTSTNQAQSAMMAGRLQKLQSDVAAKNAGENAIAIREETENASKSAQENIRRARMEFAANMARHRAGIADSGVLETTGSPLDMALAAADDQQMFETESRLSDENNRRRGFRTALGEQNQATAHTMRGGLAMLDAASQASAYRMQGVQAGLNRFASDAEARGKRGQALGSLISSVGQSAGSGYSTYRNS